MAEGVRFRLGQQISHRQRASGKTTRGIAKQFWLLSGAAEKPPEEEKNAVVKNSVGAIEKCAHQIEKSVLERLKGLTTSCRDFWKGAGIKLLQQCQDGCMPLTAKSRDDRMHLFISSGKPTRGTECSKTM